MLGAAGLTAGIAHAEDAPPTVSVSYAQCLELALAAMEDGNHYKAVAPLKIALTIDRNEPYGLIILATLCLHTGSPVRAAKEFRRARLLLPEEPLAAWGMILSAMALKKTDPGPESIPVESIATAPLLTEYMRLMRGEAGTIRQLTAGVTSEETDLLRLQIAAFAALRGGDTARGVELLKSLLSRPAMRPLREERTVLLPFLEDVPLQGGATAALAPLNFPQPEPGPPLFGRAILTPPNPLPEGAAMVAYAVDGGPGYTASTNYAPYTTDWNTTRFPNGLYTLHVTVYNNVSDVLYRRDRTVTVSNPDAPVVPRLGRTQQVEIHDRLMLLLTPRPTRKAAHFALAEQAARLGDSASALRHIESVVAIDPLYRNARASLKQYNRVVVGHRDGIWCAITSEKLVALTFDDGPHPVHTPLLLDILKQAKAPATFFVVGVRVEQSPELVQRMVAEGHEVANHSYSHQNLTFMDQAAVERELCRTSVLVREACGKRPRFYRPPGGNNNTTVVDAAELLGMAGAYWTLDGLKFENPPFKSDTLTRYIVNNIRPGAIVLLHNAPENTRAAIPDIIAALRAKGYTLVTMSELVRRARPGGPKDAKITNMNVKE